MGFEPFLGQIFLMSFNFVPKGYLPCNGQLLPINQNQALFSLLGTTYGGNGTTNFALPDLRGRAAIGAGNGAGLTPRTLGEAGGQESVTLVVANLPAHTHTPTCSASVGGQAAPASNVWAKSTNDNLYSSGTPDTAMNAGTITATGGGQGHENRQPFLTLNYVIATQGVYPSRS